MDVILGPVLRLVLMAMEFYVWIVLASVLLSWLVNFNIVNPHNRFVSLIAELTFGLTEPALRPIRKVLPLIGNFDLSPVVLIFGLIFLQDLLIQVARRLG